MFGELYFIEVLVMSNILFAVPSELKCHQKASDFPIDDGKAASLSSAAWGRLGFKNHASR